jgi:hypothetical protein
MAPDSEDRPMTAGPSIDGPNTEPTHGGRIAGLALNFAKRFM